MPNWVTQRLHTESSAVIKSIEEMYFTEGEIDFNLIIPMPKELEVEMSCKSNAGLHMYVRSMTDTITRHMILTMMYGKYDMYNKYDEAKFNEQTDKLAEECKNTPKEELLKVGEQCANNYVKYGYENWYSWRLDKWGTKWSASNTHVSMDDGYIEFDTAWGPATPIIDELSRQYPNVGFEVEYIEESGDWGGRFYVQNADHKYDYNYDRGDSELKDISDNLGLS